VTAATRLHPCAEQLQLASTIEASLVTLLPLSRLHASYEEDVKTWSSLEEIGVFRICMDEQHGGSGLGATEEALITIGLGQRLAAPSVFATIGAAHAPLDAGSGLGKRRVAAAYRHGARVLFVEDSQADLLLLRDSLSASLHSLRSCTSSQLDQGLWLVRMSEITQLSAPLAQLDASQLLRLRLLDAAALTGIAQATLDMSVAYAQTRMQFGRPIGTFQAVKHHCANMAIAARCARDQTTFAAIALDESRDDTELQIECALFVGGSAALENAGKCIQIHGGMGFSDEADPHLFLKRAQVLIAIAGGLEAANARIASMRVDA